MFDTSTVLTSLLSLIGWRQNEDPGGWQLTGLTTTDSGRYYNSAHPLLTVDNLAAIANRFDQIEVNDTDRNNAFTAWLQQHTEQAILEVLDTWLFEKVGLKSAANLLSDARLFSMGGSMAILSNQVISDFYGMEIVPMSSKHIDGTVKQIALQFDNDQTVTVEFYATDNPNRLQSVDVVYNSGGGVQWVDVNWAMEGGKTYFIGYHYSGKTGNSINGVQQFDFASSGMQAFPTEKYYNATAFHVTTNDNQVLWDTRVNSYTTGDNYGLNVELSFECDYTQFIIDNRQVLKSAILYGVGIYFLRLMISNPSAKINTQEANIESLRMWLQNEMVGHSDEKQDGSIMGRYKAALKAIQFDRGRIDRVCLPCNQQVARAGVMGASSHGYRRW